MAGTRRRLPEFRLDFRRGLPIYLQIVRQVQTLASSGKLRAGEQLPTVRELAIQLGVNFNTVARAYRLLGDAGAVSAQQGRGTFVLETTAARNAPATLQALASRYIAQAKRARFADSQIAAMVLHLLQLRGGAGRVGDNHG